MGKSNGQWSIPSLLSFSAYFGSLFITLETHFLIGSQETTWLWLYTILFLFAISSSSFRHLNTQIPHGLTLRCSSFTAGRLIHSLGLEKLMNPKWSFSWLQTDTASSSSVISHMQNETLNFHFSPHPDHPHFCRWQVNSFQLLKLKHYSYLSFNFFPHNF